MRTQFRAGVCLAGSALLVVFCLSPVLHAQAEGVVFWNKMENNVGANLVSEVGPDLQLWGPNWSFEPAMFGDGWNNSNEGSYAYANSNDIFPSSREGAFSFWWVPDQDPNALNHAFNVFFSNGATNHPRNDTWSMEFWYVRAFAPPSIQIFFLKRSAAGINNVVQMGVPISTYTGEWVVGDRVHIAFAWHNEPVILGQYIAALWVDGVVVQSWAQPNQGTLEGWRTTNPIEPFSSTTRIGDSIFPYSTDERTRGAVDNIIFWDYAKEDFSDRFSESPLCPDPDPASQGYWHRQCLGVPEAEGGIDPGRNGRGPSEPTEPGFAEELMPCADARLEDLDLYGLTTCEGMNAAPANEACERAEKQLTALVLNVCSGRLGDGCAVDVSAEGCSSTTVGALMDEISSLLFFDDCQVAAACAGAVNDGDALVDGGAAQGSSEMRQGGPESARDRLARPSRSGLRQRR